MSGPGMLIRGVVRDPAGDPIESGRVWISSGPVACPDVAILSDSQGGFALSVPTAGAYRIDCAADGYRRDSQVVEVSERETGDVVFSLKKSV